MPRRRKISKRERTTDESASSFEWAMFDGFDGLKYDETLSRQEGTGRSLRHGGGLHRGHLDDEREGYWAIFTSVSAVSGLGDHGVVEERAVARR